jgi:CheY-like chemotaxis protein
MNAKMKIDSDLIGSGRRNAVPKVLIVDDDQDLLVGQKAFLEKRGYQVETASSAAEGLKRLESFTPDLILADLMMEHYDTGFVFCKKVKDKPELAAVPIIMQTSAPKELGFTLEAYNERARKWMKVDEILTKPVPLEDLVGKIQQHLAR